MIKTHSYKWGEKVELAFSQLYKNDFEGIQLNSILNTIEWSLINSSFAPYGWTLRNCYVICNNKLTVNQSVSGHNSSCYLLSENFWSLGNSHLAKMLGRLVPSLVRTVWTSKLHSNFCFFLYGICSIPNKVLDGNSVRVFHYLAWEKPEMNSSWHSQLLGFTHNNVYILRHSFHLWETGLHMRVLFKD